MSEFARRLRDAREFRGLSQAELGEACGTTQANVSKLERANAVGSLYAVQFATVCGVSPLWLATGEGSMQDDSLYIRNAELKAALQSIEALKPHLQAAATAEIQRVIEDLRLINDRP